MKNLLVVANTPSENTIRLWKSVIQGAKHPDIDNVSITALRPIEATAEHVLVADAIIVGTTENFGAMSGLIKDFFERIYYPCLEIKQGLPYGLYIRAGLDGTGTRIGVEKILAGLRWREVHPCVLLKGEYQTTFEARCNELGQYLAAGLSAGIF